MEENKEKKPTYDEVKMYCSQLIEQNNQLKEKYREAMIRIQSLDNVLTKLPWLFKVLELENHFSREFVITCAEEIQTIMTPPEEPVQEEETSKEAE